MQRTSNMVRYDNNLLLYKLLKEGFISERKLAESLKWDESTVHYKLKRMKNFNIIKSFKKYVDPKIIANDINIEYSDKKIDWALISFKTEAAWINILPVRFISKSSIRKNRSAKSLLRRRVKQSFDMFFKVSVLPEIDLSKVNFKLIVTNQYLLDDYLIWKFNNMNVYFVSYTDNLPIREFSVVQDYYINEFYYNVLLAKIKAKRNTVLQYVKELLDKLKIKYKENPNGLMVENKNILISNNLMSLFQLDGSRKILIDESFNVVDATNNYKFYNLMQFICSIQMV
ncbi:hypothetical protein [Acidianus manzaensis]|uniref:Uncharacterized protein n=1 Tax=Acidianus manzaensis TaxID=282676 RepID=A0A1W6JWK8_9CREN|nr:hypothetical protein [Acidianus manzaensis]ARM74648.1 hypothetical protein B6F84_00480 [Acidianus manzaensis]